MGLTRAAITRPIFIFMLVVAAILLGLLSYFTMRVEQNPEVSFGTVTVSTSYVGAGPEEINNLVTRPIESAISGVNGIREVISTSREGQSIVTANFGLNVNLDAALNDMRSKIDGISNALPKDALKPQVTKFDTSATPVSNYSFTSKTLDSRGLRDLLDQKLKDRFAQINGVASADVIGGDQREIQVQVDKDKLLAYGIGITDVQQAVLASTLNVPAGKLLSGNQEYSIRVLGEFSNVDQIRNMVFRVSDPHNPQAKSKSVRLGDVATVLDTAAERTRYSRLNGKDSIILSLTKSHDGNAVEIDQAATAVVDAITKEYKTEGIEVTKTLDTAKVIKDSLNDLDFSLMFGIILVSLIVYMFLHNLRGTIIVCIAIPTCIFFTFIALKMAGFTINNMTMLALSLAIGVLVDDAIVVIENIYRHLKMGEDPKEAALNGRSEIGLAAIAITMADVVVFLPIGFMSGIVGQFFKPLALGFVFATLFSLFVSFTLTPMLASRWYKAGEDMEHATGGFAIGFERVFDAIVRRYRNTLEWSLNHRWFVFILGNSALFAVINFIMGGFSPTAKGAIQGSMTFVMISLFLGIITAGVTFINKRGLGLWAWIGLIPAIIVGTLVAAPPAGVFMGIGILFLVPAVASLFSSLGARTLKTVGSALVFGLIFPASALIGFGFGQWKQGAVFKGSFLPDSDSGLVSVSIELPTGSNLEATKAVVEEVEHRVAGNPDVKYIQSTIGQSGGGGFGGGSAGSNFAQVQLTLWDKKTIMGKAAPGEKLRTKSADSVSAGVLEKVGRIPGAFIKVSATSAFGFGSAIQIGLEGDDRDQLIGTATKIRDGLRGGAIKGVINADISSKPGKPELQAIPDRSRLADYGLSVADAGASLRTLYQGNDDAKYRVNGNEYPIRVMMSLKDRDNPDLLNQVPVKFVQGNPVFLGSVAPLQQAAALDHIDRRNRQEEIQVTADLLPGFAGGSVQAEINSWIAKEKLIPDGVKIKPLGQADAQAREMPAMKLAFGLGIVLVYMLLASLFDNLLYPLVIQMAQPQAMVGALLALVLTDKVFSLVSFIGLVALVGLVGKNAILVVDYTNTLRERGRSRHDALVEAGPIRLRPIMMTTLALILGMLPIALALGAGSEFRETIGITIIGGMILSTMLTLLVIPCSYTIFDDASIYFYNKFHRKGAASAPTDPPADSYSPPWEQKGDRPGEGSHRDPVVRFEATPENP